MPTPFVGRQAELALLDKRLSRVATDGVGVAVAIRGRRQVGKSRLVQEFCDRTQRPYVFFTATKGASPVESIADFMAELRESSLPADPELVPKTAPTNWPDALRALAAVLPSSPAIVVLDELPWLAEQDPVFDGALQTAWDRLLSSRPVLLLLLGSDLHMMERFTAYDQPFYGRADSFVLGPLNPAETGSALGLDAADAIDAHLVSGGLPGILRAWPHGTPALDFIKTECADPASPLFGVPEAALMAEFPAPDQARRVLEAVGSGDRTHANIAATAGSQSGALPSGILSPLLRRLTNEKRVLASDTPLATNPGKPALYRVADSNLRLYLAATRSAAELSRRGRPDAAYRVVERRWAAWRGRAVEPLIREALELAAVTGEFPWPDTEVVGGWWNRQFSPEIDLVGADRAPVAGTVFFAGSVKWLASPFDQHDLAALEQGAAQVPGFTPGTSGLAVVSLSGTSGKVDDDRVGLVWDARDVISAWRS
ncbi:ATP-binding protein [Streptomyces sp. NBC_00286]|uniref:ATP-binding protein n=1 Tax=Streptomyces sp. NBC_00286 TaxID=2975701 RepID=UPI002E2DCBCB|nr:ATP-binding protein [Streptomyces sp. NBC_00286]